MSVNENELTPPLKQWIEERARDIAREEVAHGMAALRAHYALREEEGRTVSRNDFAAVTRILTDTYHEVGDAAETVAREIIEALGLEVDDAGTQRRQP